MNGPFHRDSPILLLPKMSSCPLTVVFISLRCACMNVYVGCFWLGVVQQEGSLHPLLQDSLPGCSAVDQDLCKELSSSNQKESLSAEVMEKRGDIMLGIEDETGQPVSALSILSLLERVSTIIDGVQASQQRMEERQQQLETSVAAVQTEVVKLAQDHSTTATTVDKLLQKARRVSTHVKEVRSRVEKQNVRVKKVETTQDELLTRNKFRVVIYQGETEVPSVAVTKTPKEAGLANLEVEPDEYEIPADLSSDEEYMVVEEAESTRTARLKQSGLKGIENIKAAFSKENMTKTRERTRENLSKTKESLSKAGQTVGTKFNTLGEKIVPPEQREKIRQGSERLKENIAKKAPNIKLKKERAVAEGQEGADAEPALTPTKGRKSSPEVTYTEVVTESKREGPVSEEGATRIPEEGQSRFTLETAEK